MGFRIKRTKWSYIVCRVRLFERRGTAKTLRRKGDAKYLFWLGISRICLIAQIGARKFQGRKGAGFS